MTTVPNVAKRTLSVEELKRLYLNKWPGMVVMGHRVTREQALEIIIRTDSFRFSTNDHRYARELCRIAGIQYDGHTVNWRSSRQAKRRLGIIPNLEYLHNRRIVSNYVGGPHGWCRWDGTILSGNYNLGKYPEADTVYKEWQAIARAFPFLNLTCQLFDRECCEEGAVPLVEFQVKDGEATASTPGPSLGQAMWQQYLKTSDYRFGETDSERGCSLETFQEAIELCIARRAPKPAMKEIIARVTATRPGLAYRFLGDYRFEAEADLPDGMAAAVAQGLLSEENIVESWDGVEVTYHLATDNREIHSYEDVDFDDYAGYGSFIGKM